MKCGLVRVFKIKHAYKMEGKILSKRSFRSLILFVGIVAGLLAAYFLNVE